jgi:hypothetical protein
MIVVIRSAAPISDPGLFCACPIQNVTIREFLSSINGLEKRSPFVNSLSEPSFVSRAPKSN